MGLKQFLQKNKLIKTPELGLEPRKMVKDVKMDIFNVLANDEEKNSEKINDYGLSIQEVEKILEDMLLGKKISDGSFLYAWNKQDAKGRENWSTKFSAIAHSPLYHENINKNEEALYEDNQLDAYISNISRNKTTHIELWPESGKKFIQYSNQRDPEHLHLQGKKYIWVDVSGVYVDMANKNVKKIGMVCESVPGDWFEHSVFETEKNQIYYFFGGSICNLDVGDVTDAIYQNKEKTIINLLKRMRSNQPLSSTPVVLTYYEAPDKNDAEYQDKVAKLKAIYWSKESETYYDEKTHHALSDFILSGFEALWLDRSKLEFLVEYDDKISPAMIKLGAKFTEKTEIKIGNNTIVKEKGQSIWAIKSQRFSKEMFQKIAHDWWFTVKYQKSDNGVAVAVLQSKLGIYDKFKKARNVSYWILIWATLLTWWFSAKHILHQKEIQKQQEKMDVDFTNKQKIYFYGDHWYYELKTDADKIEYIDKLKDEIFENILVRYDVQGNEDEVKKLIRSYIKDSEILRRFANSENHTYNIFETGDSFVKKYGDVFLERGIDKVPYEHLKEYEQYFKDIIIDPNILLQEKTVLHGDQGTIKSNEMYKLDPRYNNQWLYADIDLVGIKDGKKTELKEIRTVPVENEDDPRVRTYLNSDVYIQDHYIKDGYLYVKKWIDTDKYNYITASAHGYLEKKIIDPAIVAYDYFYQSRPIIHDIYKKFGAIYRDMSKNHNREKTENYRWKKDSVLMMITKDLLQTWLLDNLPSKNDAVIMKYLQSFVKRNASFLEKEWISVTPYDVYRKNHKEAFENTAKIEETNLIEVIPYHAQQKYDYQYLGKYYTKGGIEYDIAEMTINGKKYIFARNIDEDKDSYATSEWIDIVSVNYYLSRGKEVVKDFFNLKNI